MSLPAPLLDRLTFDANGLVPAIAQQHDTGEVLMMAWMNAESIERTLATGRVVYWSRSRRAYWRKGDTSGHVQHLREARVDCDGDTLLLLVDQTGAACHEGTRTCFTRVMDTGVADGVTRTDEGFFPRAEPSAEERDGALG